MEFWLNKKSESDNLVILSENAVLVISCKESTYENTEQKLNAKVNPLELFGHDDITSIPYSQIQNITSLSTDEDLELKYQTSKESKEQTLYFEEISSKEKFLDTLDSLLPTNLIKSENQQSALAASISPLFALIIGSLASYLFINKFRWLTIIVGGIWILASLVTLILRIKSPPMITRWSLEGRYLKKTWNSIKTVFSYLLLTAIIVGFSSRFPDSHGKSSLSQHMNENTLSKADIEKLIDNGAAINFKDRDGYTPLMKAIEWGDDDVAIALIELGADLSILDSNGNSSLAQAISTESKIALIQSLIDHKASLNFKIEDLTPLEYAREYELKEIEQLLKKNKE